MARAPKTQRVPRTCAGGRWTEAGKWGFFRSGFRQLSMRWPPIADVMKRNRRPYSGPDRRTKWEHQCELCGEWFPAKHIEVDHIVPCGTLKSWDDVRGFLERLFCEPEGLRKACITCNQKRKGAA